MLREEEEVGEAADWTTIWTLILNFVRRSIGIAKSLTGCGEQKGD